MIVGIGGKLSGGKTCTAVAIAYDSFLQGKKVISNFMINFPNDDRNIFMPNEKLVDFLKDNYHNQDKLRSMFFNSVLICDEIFNLISSRSSSSAINALFTGFFMMAGKLDCDVIFTFQTMESQVDKILREVCNVYLNCYRVNEYGQPIIFNSRIYNTGKVYIFVVMLMDFDIKGQIIKTGMYNPEPYYQFYDTREITLLDRSKYMRGGIKDLRK